MSIKLQDLMIIIAPILGTLGTLTGFIWYRMDKLEGNLDKKIDTVESNLNKKIDDLDKKLDAVEERLGEKIDNVRDRVSRVEGQLTPTKFVTFEETWPRQDIGQKRVEKQ